MLKFFLDCALFTMKSNYNEHISISIRIAWLCAWKITYRTESTHCNHKIWLCRGL